MAATVEIFFRDLEKRDQAEREALRIEKDKRQITKARKRQEELWQGPNTPPVRFPTFLFRVFVLSCFRDLLL